MPNFKDIGDAEAVGNSYVDRLIFYVEGDDDQNLFSKFFFRGKTGDVEVKQPPGLAGGFHAVLDRVSKERPTNAKIFGILDGEALLALGEFSLYRDLCNGSDWIWPPSKDGIVLFPCWEIENVLFRRSLLVPNLYAWVWRDRHAGWTESRVLRVLLIEIFRLTEVAAFNCALHQAGKDPIRAETKNALASRRDVLENLYAEIAGFPNSWIVKTHFENWRSFFRSLLTIPPKREACYDEFMNRVDGKALLVRIRSKFATDDNILGILAKELMSRPETRALIDQLLEQASGRSRR